jgi:hypothetical protein
LTDLEISFGRPPPRSQRTSVRRQLRGSRKARRRRTLRDPTLSRSPRFLNLGLLLPLSWKAPPAHKARQVAAAVKTAKKRPRRSGAKFGVCGREGAPPQQRNSRTRECGFRSTIKISTCDFWATNRPGPHPAHRLHRAGAGSVQRLRAVGRPGQFRTIQVCPQGPSAASVVS